MLEVTFYRDDRNRPASIDARGHADFADYGNDVVCAAASAILQAARLGLERHAGLQLQAHQEAGAFRIAWTEDARDLPSLLAIVATAEFSIEEIARQYPKHVQIRRERNMPR